LLQVRFRPECLHVVGTKAIHARSSGSGVACDPLERHYQSGRVTHEVEHIVEPEAVIGYRPTVQLDLHLPYP
jgi:hypothetical protein